MTQPRIVIIGCGGMGRAHASGIFAFGGMELVGASDPFPAPRAEMQKLAPAILCSADTDELLAKTKPDLAVVATATAQHCALTLAALRAGAHVLCEKPMALTLAETDQMIAVAKTAGRMLLVHHEFRVHPRTQAAVRLVQEGAIGELVSLRGSAKGNFAGLEMFDNGTHMLDLAMLFAGAPSWATSSITVERRPATVADCRDSGSVGRQPGSLVVGDCIQALVGFANGLVLHVEFLNAPSNFHLELLGTKGSLYIPLGGSPSDTFRSRKTYADPNDPAAAWERIPSDPGKNFLARTYEIWADRLADPGQHPWALTAENGQRALEIAHAILESHFQGGNRIAIPLAQRDHPLQRRL